MIQKINDFPTFGLFNNFELIRKLKDKVNEVIDSINTPSPSPASADIIYSEDEQRIGTFMDFDLYKKTIKIEELVDGVNTIIEDASFIEHLVNAECMIRFEDAGVTYQTMAGCCIESSTSAQTIGHSILQVLYADDGAISDITINLTSSSSYFSGGTGYLTIYYTKKLI